MSKYIVEGQKKLVGTVTPSGNKNEALAALVACLLTEDEIEISNIPQIADVITVCEQLKKIGVLIEWINDSTVKLQAKNILTHKLDPKLCSKIRASLLFLGPLLARTHQVELPLPGGDLIGFRRIDTHWEGFLNLGVEFNFDGTINAKLASEPEEDIYLDEPSVTATENLLLFTSSLDKTTRLHNVACEPHVVGLCNMLVGMGASISGIGSNLLTIKGTKKLHGTSHTLGVDFMEVGSFLCLGSLKDNDITLHISSECINSLKFILKVFSKIGISPYKFGNDYIRICGTCSQKIKNDLGGRVPTIYSGPWPAFPTDLMSVAIVASTQKEGTVIFFEKMFEGRMFFTDKLMSMGANIVLCDPHRVVVTGPVKLKANDMSSPDVRAGMALLSAALIAQGTSVIHNIYQIERGYYNIDEKLLELGASITKLDA